MRKRPPSSATCAPPARAARRRRRETTSTTGAAVEAYACLLDACVAAPGGVERCRLSAADGCALRAATARAVVARGGSSLAAPGLLARALHEAAVAGAAALRDPGQRRRTRGAARVHLAAA